MMNFLELRGLTERKQSSKKCKSVGNLSMFFFRIAANGCLQSFCYGREMHVPETVDDIKVDLSS